VGWPLRANAPARGGVAGLRWALTRVTLRGVLRATGRAAGRAEACGLLAWADLSSRLAASAV
jgi:hypothetical protein